MGHARGPVVGEQQGAHALHLGTAREHAAQLGGTRVHEQHIAVRRSRHHRMQEAVGGAGGIDEALEAVLAVETPMAEDSAIEIVA